MRKSLTVGFIVASVFGLTVSQAQNQPELPRPQKEHEWLHQLVGEWEADVKMTPEPSKPPVESKGTENVRAVGGFWTVAEAKGEFGGQPFTGFLTLGYDTQKSQYVGTWIDSMNGYLWTYEGSVDKSGKMLTLEGEGPCPMRPGELSHFKETIEIKDKDRKVFTSAIQNKDGTWSTMMTINYQRKK